jgi:acyl-CoA thioesterase I
MPRLPARIFRLFAPATALLLSVMAASGPAAAEDRCAVPKSLIEAERALPHVSAAPLGTGTLRVVALGSSSTEGIGATSPRDTYPSRLQEDLRQRLGRPVEVVNKGIGGQVAAEMVQRIDTDVLPLRPALVIWQTGTNDFLKDVDEAEFERLLHQGIRHLRDAGSDVMLMEPQYIRRLAGAADYLHYVRIMRRVAAEERVPIFRRFDVMRHWVRSRHFDERTMLSADGLHMADASYFCLAELLTRMIASGIEVASAAPHGTAPMR